jgi:hypothetical protein
LRAAPKRLHYPMVFTKDPGEAERPGPADEVEQQAAADRLALEELALLLGDLDRVREGPEAVADERRDQQESGAPGRHDQDEGNRPEDLGDAAVAPVTTAAAYGGRRTRVRRPRLRSSGRCGEFRRE